VKLLLAHGADINAISPDGDHSLHIAASSGYPLLKFLVDNGANVNLACRFGTALSVACREGHQWAVEYLIERGARIDFTSRRRNTVLVQASTYRHKEIVELLIAEGANANRPCRWTTPLCAAAGSDNTDIMAMLIDAGADVNADYTAALVLALMAGNEHGVALLEANGANKLTSDRLSRALTLLCYQHYHRENQETEHELLFSRGIDVNAEGGHTLLGALRLGYGHEYIVALLEAKSAKKLTFEQLKKILLRAWEQESHENPERAFELRLDEGAGVNAEDSSPLLGALQYRHEDAVSLLGARGGNKSTLKKLNDVLIEARENSYCTQFGSAVQMLLDRGADPNSNHWMDGIALVDALRRGQEHNVALLEARGASKPTLEQLNDALIDVCFRDCDRRDRRVERALRMLLD
jgi:ankyrin repeat protein